jgi:hypothetical protein
MSVSEVWHLFFWVFFYCGFFFFFFLGRVWNRKKCGSQGFRLRQYYVESSTRMWCVVASCVFTYVEVDGSWSKEEGGLWRRVSV